jgi:transcriptional regulator with XRE-family HTH domain
VYNEKTMNDFNGPPSGASKNTPEKMGLIDDKALKSFANLLVQARFALEKTKSAIMRELNLKKAVPIDRWEEGEGFPNEEMLPKIAEAYGLKLEEVTEKWKISKLARENEIFHLRGRKYPSQAIKADPVWGEGGSKGGKKYPFK